MLRLSELLVLALVITLIVWLNVPKLLAPAFILTLVLLSAYRWYRGWWPWPAIFAAMVFLPSTLLAQAPTPGDLQTTARQSVLTIDVSCRDRGARVLRGSSGAE